MKYTAKDGTTVLACRWLPLPAEHYPRARIDGTGAWVDQIGPRWGYIPRPRGHGLGVQFGHWIIRGLDHRLIGVLEPKEFTRHYSPATAAVAE